MKNLKMFAIISSLALGAVGCASTQYSERHAADRALETNLHSELEQYGDLALSEPSVEFHAKDGTVTITGPVRSEKDREMIDTMARNTSGVIAVSDQMQVTYPPTGSFSPTGGYQEPPPAPVYSETQNVPAPVIRQGATVVVSGYPYLRLEASGTTDEPVCRRLGAQLQYNSVPPEWLRGVTITVSGGAAYLQGTVADQQQHDAIVSAVQHCRGVRVVYDRLQVM